jgi:hypothetical protein
VPPRCSCLEDITPPPTNCRKIQTGVEQSKRKTTFRGRTHIAIGAGPFTCIRNVRHRNIYFLCLCDSASLMYSFNYNLQDAKLYSILYYCRRFTCFGRFLRPSSGAQELNTQQLVSTRLAAATARQFQPNHASGSSSKTGTYQWLCVQFLSS